MSTHEIYSQNEKENETVQGKEGCNGKVEYNDQNYVQFCEDYEKLKCGDKKFAGIISKS